MSVNCRNAKNIISSVAKVVAADGLKQKTRFGVKIGTF
jgi:hypothetical protein